MVWHILKKDVRLLWVFALAVGTIHLAYATLRSWLGLFQEPSQLVIVANSLSLVCLLGIVALTIAVMHQDAVPGVRQDWLIRPIKRGDIILAKLLFVVLVVQGPLLLADLIEGLVVGFSFPASFAAAAARNVSILCYFSLPAMMIGAITRSLMESFIVSIVGLIGYVAVFLVGVVLLAGVKTSVGGSGLS
jgi:ABC-type transport system involved in multi-copper enzyme maturation permease subunit